METGASECAAEFAKGWGAYEAGDYTTALREWKVLAVQGDVLITLSNPLLILIFWYDIKG